MGQLMGQFTYSYENHIKTKTHISITTLVLIPADEPGPRNFTQKEMVVQKELKPNKQWSAAFRDDKPNQGNTVHIQVRESNI